MPSESPGAPESVGPSKALIRTRAFVKGLVLSSALSCASAPETTPEPTAPESTTPVVEKKGMNPYEAAAAKVAAVEAQTPVHVPVAEQPALSEKEQLTANLAEIKTRLKTLPFNEAEALLILFFDEKTKRQWIKEYAEIKKQGDDENLKLNEESFIDQITDQLAKDESAMKFLMRQLNINNPSKEGQETQLAQVEAKFRALPFDEAVELFLMIYSKDAMRDWKGKFAKVSKLKDSKRKLSEDLVIDQLLPELLKSQDTAAFLMNALELDNLKPRKVEKGATLEVMGQEVLIKYQTQIDFVTKRNFEEEVLDVRNKPVVVEFWAEWCPACKLQHLSFDDLTASLGNKVKIVKVDTDQERYLDKKYRHVEGEKGALPTMVIFKNGKEVKRFTGGTGPEALEQALKKYMTR